MSSYTHCLPKIFFIIKWSYGFFIFLWRFCGSWDEKLRFRKWRVHGNRYKLEIIAFYIHAKEFTVRVKDLLVYITFVVVYSHRHFHDQGIIKKTRAASLLARKGIFFLKKERHQKFHHPLFNPFSKCFASK